MGRLKWVKYPISDEFSKIYGPGWICSVNREMDRDFYHAIKLNEQIIDEVDGDNYINFAVEGWHFYLYKAKS